MSLAIWVLAVVLLATRWFRVLFLSVEPLLGPVDLRLALDAHDMPESPSRGEAIDWVIVGGESGSKARLCDVDWIRDIVRQCKSEPVPLPCFVKQLGAEPVTGLQATGEFRTNPATGKRQIGMFAKGLRLADKKGGDPMEWPEDLRIREFPEVRP